MANIEIMALGKKDYENWQEYVYSSKRSNFFHLIEWKKILEDVYGYEPLYYIAKTENDEIVGIFPIFYVKSLFFGKSLKSLPFHFLGGPLYDTKEVLLEFLREMKEITEKYKASYLEIKSYDDHEGIEDYEIKKQKKYTSFVVPLSKNYEDVYKTFKKNVRWSIKKSQEKIHVYFATNYEGLEIFYDLYVRGMRNIGLPTHNFKLFKQLWDIFYNKDMVKISIATFEGMPIATMFIFLFNNKILYMWGSRNVEYRSLNANPALHWNTIKWGCENGYKYFDFGATSPTEGNAMFYKSRWGTFQEDIFFYSLFTDKTLKLDYHTSFNRFKSIWRYIPIEIARRFGPFLTKEVG